MTIPLLSLLIGIPLLASIVLASGKVNAFVKEISIGASLLQVLVLAKVFISFNSSNTNFQLVEQYQWIQFSLGSLGQFMSQFHLGLDGLSLGLVILTVFISLIAVWNSDSIQEKKAAYFSLILLLNASIIGCFLSRDYCYFISFLNSCCCLCIF